MSDESNATSQGIIEEDAAQARVPRREALKGLGALAVTSTAFAAVGCSTDAAEMTGESSSTAATPAGASPTAAASDKMASSTAAGASASQAIPAAMPTSSMTGIKPATTGTASTPMSASAGSAAPTSAAAAGAAAPVTGGAGPGAAGATASGSAGTGAMAATTDLSSLACILTPDMTEGPFFIEEKLNRGDLVMGETAEAVVMATPLALTIGVYKVDGMTCTPLPGLQVDIWHADALGVYSDVASGFVQSTDTRGKKFLRGYQITNESGLVDFATIYPGWYMSRTIHVHFKIRMPMGGNAAYDFTSQMFFDEKISKEVLSTGPYAKAPGTRSVFNDDDHIFNGTAMNGQKPSSGQKAPGLQIMPTMTKLGSSYVALLKVGLKM
jgi:protocatechuate 3,4-dioxygenase beta subunit